MTTPGIIVGRNLLAPEGYPNEQQGRFHSSFQGSTPKFARNVGPRRSEFVETMARLSLTMPAARIRSMLASLPAATAAAARTLLVDRASESATSLGYFDFLLTSVSQQQQEREQAVDTLTDNTVIFYSGQSAPILACSGMFLNTYQDDQNVWFQLLYADLLRGSALARRGLAARFRYDSFYFAGYLTGLQTQTEGGAKNYVQFSFNFRVKQIEIATPIVYNPGLASSAFNSNLFQRDDAPGSDDTTRNGVESAEQPTAASETPAGTSDGEVDERETAATAGATPGETQEARDAAVNEEQEAMADGDAEFALDIEVNSSFSILDSQGNPTSTTTTRTNSMVFSAGGDVRANLPADAAAQVQTLSPPTPAAAAEGAATEAAAAAAAPTPPPAPAPATAAERAAQELAQTAGRGTPLVSPTTGATVAAGTIASGVARVQPEWVRDPARPGPDNIAEAPPVSAEQQARQDIYRLGSYGVSRGSTQVATAAPARPRTRQRPTP